MIVGILSWAPTAGGVMRFRPSTMEGCVPRYYFDIVNGGPVRDDVGTECTDDDEMRYLARQAIPEIARDQIPKGGERHFFTVVVRDESGAPVYTATLSYAGMDLVERPG